MLNLGGSEFQFNEIQNAYELYKTYEKNKSALKEGKVTDLFFLHTGHGLEFVKKYSLTGQWKRFVSWVKLKVGIEDRSFDVERNLSEVGKLYENVFSKLTIEDTKQLDKLAEKLDIKPKTLTSGKKLSPGEVLRESLLELGIHLNQLKYRVERSRFEKKLASPDFAAPAKIAKEAFVKKKEEPVFEQLKGIHIPLYAKRVQSSFTSFRAQYEEEHAELFKGLQDKFSKILSADEIDAAVTCIVTSGKKSQILEDLKRHDNKSLLLAMRKTLTLDIPRDTLKNIRTGLAKLAPIETKAVVSKVTLQDFPSLLGTGNYPGDARHDLDANKELAFKFLQAYGQKPEAPSGIPKLQSLVGNAISISDTMEPAELKEKIKSALAKEQKCLLLGGYEGHPIVYSIELQPDAKYTFKVYNQEPNKLLPPILKDTNEAKQGYLEFKDISEEKLFKQPAKTIMGAIGGAIGEALFTQVPSLSEALIALQAKSAGEAEGYFAKNVVEQLGKEIAGPEIIHHFLRPELPGTPASRAIFTALSSSLDQKEAIRLQAEFDMHLLETFEKPLKEQITQGIPKEKYQNVRTLANNMKRAIEECVERLNGLPGADVKLALYNDLLDRLEGKLLACQKEFYTAELTARLPIETQLAISPPKGKKPPKEAVRRAEKPETVPAEPMKKEEIDLLAQIRTGRHEKSLAMLAALSPKSESYQYICDAFFKNIGTLEAIKLLHFKEPQKAIETLQTMIRNIGSEIDAENPERSNAERFGMVLLASYALEETYRKLSAEEKILTADFPSTLASASVYSQVQKLRSSDPYWVAEFREILSLREALPEDQKEVADHLFAVSLHKVQAMPLGELLSNEISSWVRNTQFAMPKKIDSSISKDRKDQEIRIEKEIAAEKVRLEGYEKNKTELETKKALYQKEKEKLETVAKTIEAEVKAAQDEYDKIMKKIQTRAVSKEKYDAKDKLDDLNEKKGELAKNAGKIKEFDDYIKYLGKQIQELEGKIVNSLKRINGGIKEEVHADPQYWPWGIGKDDKPVSWPKAEVAAFFLASSSDFLQKKLGVKEVLPKPFRTYFETAILSKNIFNKTEGAIPEHIPVVLDDKKRVNAGLKGAPFKESVEHPDFYLTGLRNYKELYQHLYKTTYIDELAIPHAATVGVAKALAEKNRAPSRLAGVGRAIGGAMRAIVGEKQVDLEDELRELCQLHCSRELQVDSVISYFHENPRKLFDADGRLLFHALIFESDLLLSAFKDERTRELVATRLGSLFHDVIKSAIQLKDAETCANVIWIAANVQKQLNSVSPKDQIITVFGLEDLFNLTERFAKAEFQSQWGVVFESLLAASGHLFEGKTESPQEQKLFVYALMNRAICNQNDVAKDKFCWPRERDAANAITLLKEHLASVASSKMAEMLNAYAPGLLGKMFPALSNETFIPGTKKDQPGVFTTPDRKTVLSLTNGILTSSDPKVLRPHTNPVPNEVRKILLDQKIYADEQAFPADFHCYREDSVFSIYDKKRDLNLKCKDKDVFVQLKGMPWCHHIPIDAKLQFPGHKILENYHQLFDFETKKTYLCDRETFKPIFETDDNGNIISSETKLLLAEPAKDSFLSSFEDSGCTFYWTDAEKKIEQIDFPRLDITLEKRPDGNFGLKGSKDWIASSAQFVPQFDQKSGFLVLENTTTKEKKVLFPVWDLDVGGAFDFKPDQSVGRTLEFAMVEGKLVPKSLEGRLFLTRLHLARGNIDQAESLLYVRDAEVSSRKLASKADFAAIVEEKQLHGKEKDKAYREELNVEADLLKSIAHAPLEEFTPRTLKLQMQALYLLKKNEEQFPKEPLKEEPLVEVAPPTKIEIEEEIDLVGKYLEFAADARALTPSSELLVLQNIMNKVEDRRNLEAQDPQMDKLIDAGLEGIEERIIKLEQDIESEPTHEFKEPILATAKAGPHEALLSTDSEARKRYDAFRHEGRFPFNPHNIAAQEFKDYLPFLQEECAGLTSIESAQKSGLIAALTTLSQFAKEAEVRGSAGALLASIQKLKQMTSAEIYKNLHQLSLMRSMVEDRGLTRKLKQEYFAQEKKEARSRISADILADDSPEIPASDKTIRKKFEDIRDDIEIAQTILADEPYALNEGKDLTLLRNTLHEQKEQELKLLAHQEAFIVNSVAQALASDPKLALEFASKRRFYPTIEEICLLASRKNFDAFAARFYPQIGPEGRKNLRDAVKTYFFQKETVQQLGRSLDTLDALLEAQKEGKAELIETLQDSLAQNLDKTRAYPPDHKYAMIFLFLETALNVKLRQDQIQNILKFAQGIIDGKELVLKIIMGSGKSELIQPVLAILLAEPGTLSTVIVPASLFQQVRNSLTRTLGSAADQLLVSFPFDMELSKDTRYLDTVLKRLEEAKERGSTVLLSPRQKHSILTSLYESFYNLAETPNRIEKLKLEIQKEQKPKEKEALERQLRALENPANQQKDADRAEKISAICDFLQLYEIDQIDEIDFVMNPKVIFKRPIGEAKIFDKEGNFERPKLLTELLLSLATNQELNNEVSIDFVNAMLTPPDKPIEKKGVEINEQIYLAKVQPFLVTIAIELLQKKNQQLATLIEKDRAKIERFLNQTSSGEERKWIRDNVTDKAAQDLIESAALAISATLKSSLLNECNANYGKDPALDKTRPSERKYIARPYDAPDAPKPTVYGDPHEKIIYSVQYYLYNGIPLADAKDMLLEWQGLAGKEMRAGRKEEDTTWYGRFHTLIKKHLKPEQTIYEFLTDPKSPEFTAAAEAFQKVISKDPETILEFCQKKIFNENKIYTASVISTPLTLVGSSNKTYGYAGTMNKAILASNMELIAERGIDGKTIVAMESKFINGIASVDTLPKGAKLLDEAIRRFQNPDNYVFHDSGNWLKEEKNIENFVKRVLEQCGRADIEGVVYHDASNNLLCLEKDENGHVRPPVPYDTSRLKYSPEKRLTIIQRKNETGANILQKPTAKGFMSVRKGQTLPVTLQSASRMRQILLGQTVSLIYSDEVRSHVAQSLLEGLLSHKELSALIETKQPIGQGALEKAIEGLELRSALKETLKKTVQRYNEKGQFTLIAFQDSFSQLFTPDSGASWRYFTANLGKYAERDKPWDAARHRMRDTLEKPVRAILTDRKIPLSERAALFNKMRSIFVQVESDSRFKQLVAGHTEIDAEDAVQRQVDFYLAAFEKLKDSPLFAKVCEKIQSGYEGKKEAKVILEEKLNACVNLEDLPDKIRVADIEEGGESEIEHEAEVEEEAEEEKELYVEEELYVEREIQPASVPPPEVKEYEVLAPTLAQSKAYNIDNFFSRKFDSIASVLPEDLKLPARNSIEFSPNFILDRNSKIKLDKEEHASNHLAARYMLALSDAKGKRYILVSHEDAARIRQGLLGSTLTAGKQAMLCTLDGAVVVQSSKEARRAFEKEDMPSLLLQAKFITAKANFSSKEVGKLKTLIETSKDPSPAALRAACRKYYENCMRYLESARNQYAGSYLEKVLG